MTDISSITDAASLRRFLIDRFRAVPGEEPGVLHVAAAWRPAAADRNVVLRIGDRTPKSALDFLLLNLSRARADAIVTTGRILREEPEVTHDLAGPAGVREALQDWRRETLGLEPPPRLLILTSGRDLDPEHPALHSWARPLVFCPASSVDAMRQRVEGAGVDVVGHDETGLLPALDHLTRERGARRISIEAGPTTARTLYTDPPRIDELLLSVFSAATLPPGLAAGELPPRAELERILGPPRATFTAVEPSGPWSFEHYRCAIVSTEATSR